ncbi:hypothetical protein BD410DRAFT_842485 [Rickenella mellea]|uniref:F-box domain-containing protein n=1 Tax=Rickenella mellea TaxID=50990 RepID=A0A4Y7PV58_9AGAM|nr:hypothetical protein BD410DRAFT_842485 [Rickenella mellea]
MAPSNPPRKIARLPQREAVIDGFAASVRPPLVPAEILVAIFTWLRDSDNAYSDAARRATHSQTRIGNSWIFVTHVCRYWRHAALECGTLWCKINSVQSFGLIRACLDRSKNTPLEVRITGMPNEIVTTVLLENLPRIRDLDVTLVGPSHWVNAGHFKNLWGQPTPLLESVTVTVINGHKDQEAKLPIPILQWPHPVLKSVNLHECPAPWDSLIFRGLTELEIVYNPTRTPAYLIPDPFYPLRLS